ncbi:hypothetical protein HPP92_025469 [Vanilla planifolia]|uniref:Uncharacterized protein n=1 Tax=Vanilla planifolia TaxID=51239 RepID=A0A835UAM7_VANPL|nr:hypothetical protein HPP92_025469 [Vanilla planifolia]
MFDEIEKVFLISILFMYYSDFIPNLKRIRCDRYMIVKITSFFLTTRSKWQEMSDLLDRSGRRKPGNHGKLSQFNPIEEKLAFLYSTTIQQAIHEPSRTEPIRRKTRTRWNRSLPAGDQLASS